MNDTWLGAVGWGECIQLVLFSFGFKFPVLCWLRTVVILFSFSSLLFSFSFLDRTVFPSFVELDGWHLVKVTNFLSLLLLTTLLYVVDLDNRYAAQHDWIPTLSQEQGESSGGRREGCIGGKGVV